MEETDVLRVGQGTECLKSQRMQDNTTFGNFFLR